MLPIDIDTNTHKISQESRLLPKQSHSHLHHWRQRQIHAAHELRSTRNALLELRLTTTVKILNSEAKYAVG